METTVELTKSGHRPLHVIAGEIRRDWKGRIYFGAVPYLEAMADLEDITDGFYSDTAVGVVRYFLSNAVTWRGDKAKEIKAELKKILGDK